MSQQKYSNISNLRGTNSVPSWQAASRQRKALSAAKSQKELTARPSWDSRPVNS